MRPWRIQIQTSSEFFFFDYKHESLTRALCVMRTNPRYEDQHGLQSVVRYPRWCIRAH
ncbi:hypothetical protein PILCRDRAFT_748670 [Piloderma croceum F 1598]|uniref:Uncharacterized protein n=1 Tax=Piloderma croceum (strain F 1598) TaxID=765440 RepID=A0A0C3EVG8_PILCF|nr:hypothetical protein PILCRDRAFT_748670 [Piloderma croceum F 1598]